jgi:hypothetical protein
VGPGDHDGAGAPQKLVADRLRQRAVADLPLEHGLELGIATGDRIADDDEVEVGRDVLRRIAGHRRDRFRREEIAHWRIDVLIGSADVVPAPFEQRGERGHRGAADADQVDAEYVTQQATPRR